MNHQEAYTLSSKSVPSEVELVEETNTKRKYNVIQDYLDGPTLIQRSDAKEIEIVDEDRVNSVHKSAEQDVWLGVWCPVVQNIFGIVLFIRFPSLTAELGLGMMLVCVFLCITNTFFTALCVSAIVTNGKVKNGGNYFMISRTLGPAFGGSVAILEFLASSFGSAFYFLGASETLLTWTQATLTGDLLWDMRILSLGFWVLSYLLNMVGLKYVSRTDFVNLMIVIIGVTMIYIGCFVAGVRDLDDTRITGFSKENFDRNWFGENNISFSTAIGICYPAVTGIMAGVNRSGDLKNPAKDIPRGTLGGFFFTSFFYVTFPILLAGVSPKSALMDMSQIFSAQICWPHPAFVSLAIIIASAGAGLQTTVNAPRIFMALCEDKLLPLTFFGKHINRSMMMTATITFCIIMIGKLDAVAPYLTMFFLMAYFWVCVSCLALDLLNSPNWRPTFRYYNKLTSFCGLISCLIIMFIISWLISLIAIAIQFGLFIYIMKTSRKNWGDSIEYFKVSMSINSLYKINKMKYHVKNWRPNILVLTSKKLAENDLFSSPGTLNFLKYLNKSVGLVIYGNVCVGNLSNKQDIRNSELLEKQLLIESKKKKLRMVIKTTIAPKYEIAVMNLIHSSGLGALNPNTIVMSWPPNWKDSENECVRFTNYIRLANNMQFHIIILKPDTAFDVVEKYKGTIDIWSFSYEKGLGEMIVHILRGSKHWKSCQARLFLATSLGNQETIESKKNLSDKIIDFFKRYRLLDHIEIKIIDISDELSERFNVELEEKINVKEKLLIANQDAFPETQEKIKNQIDILKQLNERKKLGKGFQSFRSDVVHEAQNMIECQSHELNQKILEKSVNVDLVVMNLPKYSEDEEDAKEFMEICEGMTKSLKRVVFIKNSGIEVITELV